MYEKRCNALLQASTALFTYLQYKNNIVFPPHITLTLEKESRKSKHLYVLCGGRSVKTGKAVPCDVVCSCYNNI